jgi:protein involved in sex pheromone biosynthesis
MFSFYFPVKTAVAISLAISLLLLSACTEQSKSEASIAAQAKNNASSTQQVKKAKTLLPLLEVYKSPTCSCCEKWISHID